MINYIRRYDGELEPRLRRSFPEALAITNYAQAFQDIFVLSVLGGKRLGTYVEIGGNDAIVDNNTYLLEDVFGWRGVSIEIFPALVSKYNAVRKNKCLCVDATQADYASILKAGEFPSQIDYLQVDIEPARNTFLALAKLPLTDYRFSVITFETEVYSSGREVQADAQSLLLSHGYELVAKDVCILGRPFEDWYVDPSIVPPDVVKLFRTEGKECSDCVLK